MAADKDIQKIVVPTNKLPYSTTDGYYYIRYRVITEDGGNGSSWSSKFQVPVVSISAIVTDSYNPNYKMTSDSKAIKLTWDISDILKGLKLETFDVHAKWSDKDTGWDLINWKYISTTKANSIAATVPEYTDVMSIYSVTHTSSTATYLSKTTHNISIGDRVKVSGLSPSGYNGVFTVTGVNPSATSFTVSNTTNATVTDAIGTVSVVPKYVRFWVQAPTQSKSTSESALLFVVPFNTKPSIQATNGVAIDSILNVDGGTPSKL